MRRRSAALIVGCLVGCGDTVVVDHGFIGEGDPPGNYPEPALTRCGPLPEGVTALPDLGAAWAVVALPGAVTEEDDPVAAGSVWLRFGDHGFQDCGGAFFETFECAVGDRCHWAMSIGLTEPPVVSAVYDLGALPDSQYTISVGDFRMRPGGSGTLILHEVTPSCVVGELVDLDVGTGAPRSGGFVAETCQRQCIPSAMGWGC